MDGNMTETEGLAAVADQPEAMSVGGSGGGARPAESH